MSTASVRLESVGSRYIPTPPDSVSAQPYSVGSRLPPSSKPDPELVAPHLSGYSSFSALIATDPDLQIYRRFNKLSARNILYLQSEILEAERRLEEFDEVDMKDSLGPGGLDVMLSTRCWEAFARKAKAGNERERERMELIKQIRELVKEYQDAIVRQSHLLSLENPAPRVRKAVTRWFAHIEPLTGYGRDLFADAKDLVALRTAPDQDRLSLFLQDHLGYLFRETRTHLSSSWGSMYYFPEVLISRIVSMVSVLLAAMLLLGAIVGLYFVRDQGARLGMIAAFTTAFAASIGLLTSARRAEVYASTAAYAAVLVVFISANIGGNNQVQLVKIVSGTT